MLTILINVIIEREGFNYLVSCLANEVQRLPMLMEHQIDLMKSILNRNSYENARTIRFYLEDNDATDEEIGVIINQLREIMRGRIGTIQKEEEDIVKVD